jgi:hypothetical protein
MKKYSDRKELTKWKKEVNSNSGYIEGERLTLSKLTYNPDIHHCDLIILNDHSATEFEVGFSIPVNK